MSYCTKDEVRRRSAGGSGSGGTATTTAWPDAEVDALIEQVSRVFDLECGVEPEHFEAATGPSTARTFYGDGTNYLRLDPYVADSLTGISLPAGYAAPDYVERDGYLIITAPDGSLLTRRGFSNLWCGGWREGVPVSVTAQWGYSATPADVKLAIIEWVINLRWETDPQSIKLTNLEGQPLREKIPPRVAEIARFYRLKHRTVFV